MSTTASTTTRSSSGNASLTAEPSCRPGVDPNLPAPKRSAHRCPPSSTATGVSSLATRNQSWRRSTTPCTPRRVCISSRIRLSRAILARSPTREDPPQPSLDPRSKVSQRPREVGDGRLVLPSRVREIKTLLRVASTAQRANENQLISANDAPTLPAGLWFRDRLRGNGGAIRYQVDGTE